MKRASLPLIALAGFLLAAAALYRLTTPQAHDPFGSIVYRSRDGLCSVSPTGEAPPRCTQRDLDDPSYSPNGELIAAATGKSAKPTELLLIDRRGNIAKRLPASGGFIRPVWSPDGQSVLAVSYDVVEEIARWDWKSGEKKLIPIRDIPDDCHSWEAISRGRWSAIQGISISPSGRRLVFQCAFASVYVADVDGDSLLVRRKIAIPAS